MTDAGGPPQSPLGPNANINALVEAIDARARQAGSDGAATLMRGMIGSVSEVLASIQDRLDRLEDLLTDGGGGGGAAGGGNGLAEQVQAGLASFNARLGRLEEAFVQAVEDSGSGTDAVVDQLRRTIVETLAQQAPAAAPTPAALDAGPLLDEVLNPIRARLTGIEQLIRARGEERSADPGALVKAALAPVVERLDGLEIAVRSASDANSERIARIDAATAPVAARLAASEERLAALAVPAAAAPTDAAAGPALDPELVARLEAAIEQLANNEATAKLVSLVEERVAAGVRAVVERSEATGRSVDALGETVGEAQAQLRARVDEIARAVESASAGLQRVAEDAAEAANQRLGGRFTSLGDRIAGLEARIEALAAAAPPPTAEAAPDYTETLARIEAAIAGLPPAAEAAPDYSETLTRIEAAVAALSEATAAAPATPAGDERVVEAIRREAELLTQRVAALAVGVEAARALLQQHVEETENSLGKKAGVVTRRLAADLGIGAGRRGRGSGRDRRQLGPGDS